MSILLIILALLIICLVAFGLWIWAGTREDWKNYQEWISHGGND